MLPHNTCYNMDKSVASLTLTLFFKPPAINIDFNYCKNENKENKENKKTIRR